MGQRVRRYCPLRATGVVSWSVAAVIAVDTHAGGSGAASRAIVHNWWRRQATSGTTAPLLPQAFKVASFGPTAESSCCCTLHGEFALLACTQRLLCTRLRANTF